MENVQKTIAVSAVGLYVLGALITGVHLSRFGVFDLGIAKISYIFCGGVCVFYLVIRATIAVLFVDLRSILSILKNAKTSIYENLKETRAFKIIDRMVSLRIISWFFRSYSSEGMANKLIQIVVFAAILLIVYAYTLIFDLNKVQLSISDVIEFPPVVAFFLLTQIAYIVWLYFIRAFRSSTTLKVFWRIVFSLLVLADIGFYSIVLHPLVKPSFGGGTVYSIEMMSSVDQTGLKKLLSPKDKGACGVKAFLIHAAPSAYYITEKYQLYFKAGKIGKIVQTSPIVRIEKTEAKIIRISIN